MNCKQYEIWLADLNPQIGTETGKVRPVLVIQTDLLNQIPHLSTLVCPLTTNITTGVRILRVSVRKGTANLHQDCDIMIDQIRAIDNMRLIKKIGSLPCHLVEQVKANILIMMDINPQSV
jgi:mRNA interferase MazF